MCFDRPKGFLNVTPGGGIKVEDVEEVGASLLNKNIGKIQTYGKGYIGRVELPFNIFFYKANVYDA